MTRPTSQLFPLVGLLVVMVGMVVGCDPAPSTPLAPDQKLPDTSKMSSADIDKLLKKNHDGHDKR